VNRSARLSSPVLDAILEAKQTEVERLRRSAAALRERAGNRPPGPDFDKALRAGERIRVIAEVKRRSPSAGEIRGGIAAASVARAYVEGGAAAISVLTDAGHFGGSLDDLEAVADCAGVAVLRKDFTLDPLQLWEARGAGASAVLLIARILDDAQLVDLGAAAQELALSALVEVHDEAELERALRAGAGIIGVNNRDLTRFTTDLAVTERLARHVPRGVVLVAESGIGSEADVERVAAAGADAVLVGEALMRASDPAAVVRTFSAVHRQDR
jgi:indole-3-glycerol phosphate synthase